MKLFYSGSIFIDRRVYIDAYIDMRYEKKSTILTTNINFSNLNSIFYDAVVANAILDRVLHHSHVISINGCSYRVKDYIIKSE